MLVLSRKSGEAITFPALDITVTVSHVRGKAVTLGVEAPDEIRILRKELVPQLEKTCSSRLGNRLNHAVRNRLNSVGLSLNVLLRQVESGKEANFDILKKALEDLHVLDESLVEVSDNRRASKDGSQRLALLVEDNENESALLSAFLRDYGFRVVNALDGQAALNFMDFAPKQPDIVLLDMNMPGMNGEETVEVIRKRTDWSDLKLFAVSGMAPEDTRIQIGAAGVNRWFRKPIQPDELVRQIDRDLAA
ncbi:MAG: response regulator [Pirellulaceae bacterium]